MIIPSLNPTGRFGHQFHNFLSAYLVSKFFGNDIAHCEFLGNAMAWNNYIRLPGRYYDLSPSHAQGITTMDGQSISKTHLKHYYSQLESRSENVFIKIPIDQWAGDSLMNLLPRYRDEFSKMLLSRRPPANQIALHLRRGDVSSTSSISLYTPDSRYIDALKIVHSRHPTDWPICIYSEGSPRKFMALAEALRAASNRDVILRVSESSFCIDSCDDFLEMISSRVLLCSYSTYAYCAIYFSEAEACKYFIADNRSNGNNMLQILKQFGARIIKTDGS
jgi:hypothetical protein